MEGDAQNIFFVEIKYKQSQLVPLSFVPTAVNICLVCSMS